MGGNVVKTKMTSNLPPPPSFLIEAKRAIKSTHSGMLFQCFVPFNSKISSIKGFRLELRYD